LRMNSSSELINEDQSFYPPHTEEIELKTFVGLGKEDPENIPADCFWDHKDDVNYTKDEAVIRKVTYNVAVSSETTPSFEASFSEGDYPVIDTSDSVLRSSEVDRLIPDDEEAEVIVDINNNRLSENTDENESAANVRRVLTSVEVVIDVDNEIEVQGQVSKKRKLEEIDVEDESEVENDEDIDCLVDGSLVDNFPEINDSETEINESLSDNEETVVQSQPSTSPTSEVDQLVPNNSSELDLILYSERTSDPLPENWRKLLLPHFNCKQDWENED